MKELSMVLVMLVILWICASAYGDIDRYNLIYNVSATVKGADNATGLKTTAPLRADFSFKY
jgi:hypothetical protein